MEEEGRWIAGLIAALLGARGLVVYRGLSCGARYESVRREVHIDEALIARGDYAFALAHELGHWAWCERLGGSSTHVGEEIFANGFARAPLGRDARDTRTLPTREELAAIRLDREP